ncbi:MAG: HlyD family type I secretion periplasmic adaptor subunit [Rhodocyclaceae bacterium]|nr:HlyD family type I secretion periplasmic adaptor subunit [Rhodocyclaceae bacterium]
MDTQRLPTAAATNPALEGEIVLPTDTRKPMRIGLLTLALGFGGFLAWAALAPLDEGVPTHGMVTLDTKRKAVQHQTGGIVKEVLVREGEWVKEGQPLLKLDDATIQASFEASRQNYSTLRAMEGRLQAEQAGLEKIEFHPELVAMAQEDPIIARTLKTQEQLFHSRRQALAAELAALTEAIEGQRAAARGYEGMRVARETQLAFLHEDLKGLRELVKEGYAPRSRQSELERQAAEAMAALADIQANLQRARTAIAELKNRQQVRLQEYRKEVDAQLAEVRRQVEAEREKFHAIANDLARSVIRAPAEGQVVGLGVQTVGGVIAPGQKIADVVPENDRLLLETRIPPHLIDSAKQGEIADVRFSTFAHSPQLVVEAKIISVSQDLLMEPNQPPYYLARLEITEQGMKKLGKRQLQPGMPVEVIIKTGERSLLTYLMHPLIKRIAASMKEE